MSEKPSPRTFLILCGIALLTLVGTLTGVAIGRVINNDVISQDKRSSPSAIQPMQQATPTLTTQEPAPVQPIPLSEKPPVAAIQEPAPVQPAIPRATLPVETPVQVQQNFPTQTGKCVNPDDIDSRGRRCGRRSAYTKGPTTSYDSSR